MANPKWSIFIYLVVIFFMAALALYVMGGMIYHKDHYAKSIHVENSCEVIASNYYESKCTGSRGSTYVCFRPVWLVFYSISQDVTEIPITAKIEHDGFRTTADAENNLNQYQIGMSYSCWCNVVDLSIARWDEPSTFVGMMLLIFGGVASIVCFVGIYFSYRARKD